MSILTTIGITAAADAIRRLWGRLVRKGKEGEVDERLRPHLKTAIAVAKRHGHKWSGRHGIKLFLELGTRVVQDGDEEWVWRFQGMRVFGVMLDLRPFEVYLGSDGKGRFSIWTAIHEVLHCILYALGIYGHPPQYRNEPEIKGWSDTGYRVPADGLITAHLDLADGTSMVCQITQGERQMLIASACNGGEAWV